MNKNFLVGGLIMTMVYGSTDLNVDSATTIINNSDAPVNVVVPVDSNTTATVVNADPIDVTSTTPTTPVVVTPALVDPVPVTPIIIATPDPVLATPIVAVVDPVHGVVINNGAGHQSITRSLVRGALSFLMHQNNAASYTDLKSFGKSIVDGSFYTMIFSTIDQSLSMDPFKIKNDFPHYGTVTNIISAMGSTALTSMLFGSANYKIMPLLLDSIAKQIALKFAFEVFNPINGLIVNSYDAIVNQNVAIVKQNAIAALGWVQNKSIEFWNWLNVKLNSPKTTLTAKPTKTIVVTNKK
jgi:hypothetical protein